MTISLNTLKKVQAKADEFFAFIAPTAEIVARVDDRIVFVDISTEDHNDQTLIGTRGEVLFSLQLLLSLLINKEEDEPVQIVLDVNGYRERREKALQQLVTRIAEQVRATGKPVELEPMRPFERRLVHVILQDFTDLDSTSEGEEPYRRVIIKQK